MKTASQEWISYYLPLGFALTIFSFPIANIQPYKEFFLYSTLILGMWHFKDQLSWKPLMGLKTPLILLFLFLGIALISLLYSVDPYESLKKIKITILENILVLILTFLLFFHFDEKSLKKTYLGLGTALGIHAVINIGIWLNNGGYPFRAGGLLDTPGGEMFSVWATYFLAFIVSLYIFSRKPINILFFILALLSIIANNTRATYVGMISLLSLAPLLSTKPVSKKVMTGSVIFVVLLAFYFTITKATNETRHNYEGIITHLDTIITTPPSKMDTLIDDLGLDPDALARLAMWKGAVYSILDDPLTPRGYGADLFSKTYEAENSKHPELIPYALLSQMHNDFLGMFYALGFFGFVVFSSFFLYIVICAISIIKHSSYPLYKSYAFFIALGIVAQAASMFFASLFTGSEAKIIFIFMAILAALKARTQLLET